MAQKQYQNAHTVELSDYIETNRFRTVLHEQYEEPHGITEIPVEIEMNEKFSKTLSFPVPWDRWLYGFVRENHILKSLNDANGGKSIKVISLHDWDKHFLMLIETETGEIANYIESDDVRLLLEGCLRPPEQRSDI